MKKEVEQGAICNTKQKRGLLMKSIAFYNNKGGVGKTTSAINIAYELAKNSKVIIINVDGQANC